MKAMTNDITQHYMWYKSVPQTSTTQLSSGNNTLDEHFMGTYKIKQDKNKQDKNLSNWCTHFHTVQWFPSVLHPLESMDLTDSL